jgi:hypothetical protein
MRAGYEFEDHQAAENMQMIVTDQIVLHRREDPQNEYRELLLCEDQEHWFAVYQIIRFANAADFYHREGMGTEREMRRFFSDTAAQLCQEGFVVC